MMRSFPWFKNGIKVYMMSSAPGLLEGDEYQIEINSLENSKFWLTTQSYEKIYPSDRIGAKRTTMINVEKNAYLRYDPLPTIPFVDSIFQANTTVHLADETSRFTMLEILTAGRIHKQKSEIFAYQQYKSLVDVYKGQKLIYRDNTNFKPRETDMQGFGMYEGYTHLANLLIINFALDNETVKSIRDEIEAAPEIIGGVTRLATGDSLVRLFGYSGQSLMDFGNNIITDLEQKL